MATLPFCSWHWPFRDSHWPFPFLLFWLHLWVPIRINVFVFCGRVVRARPRVLGFSLERRVALNLIGSAHIVEESPLGWVFSHQIVLNGFPGLIQRSLIPWTLHPGDPSFLRVFAHQQEQT